MKKTITENIDITYLGGATLDELFMRIRNEVNARKIKGEIQQFCIEKEYGYEDSVSAVLEITYVREETAAEIAARENSERIRLEHRKKEYERLRKEFEKE